MQSDDEARVLETLKTLEPLIYAANDGKTRDHFDRLLIAGHLEKPPALALNVDGW